MDKAKDWEVMSNNGEVHCPQKVDLFIIDVEQPIR